MIWRILLFELIVVVVVAGVWLLGPIVGIKSVFWRIFIILMLVLPPIVIVLWRFFAGRRAASGLANAMADQGLAHQDQVRPDRRDEINALNEAFNQALASLKKSRLGGGRGNALYALPWYMIIGPPAVGKSTALLRSGLRFPFTPGERKAIRGVGGTRNCDWWFSDQAILLDTAGRYSTEDDDQEEWTAFLRMIRRYRKKQPLNGLIIAISVGDLLTAKAEDIDDLAHQVRSRLDQVIRDLELSLPVYLLFTKCDLISGFVEFFGDLKKSIRSQVLGFTVPLTDARTDIQGLFSEEFDQLVDRVRKKGLQRLAGTRPQERISVFQFPMQLAAAKEPLEAFATILLNPNPYHESPRLRGVYFCSGTQEGRPIDRVMSAMGRGLGLRDLGGPVFQERSAKKSYFLANVFTDVLVPDRELAGRTATGLRRMRQLRIAALVGAILFSAGALGISATTFTNNRSMVGSTLSLAKHSRITTPEDPRKVAGSLKALELLGQRVDTLRKYQQSGVPLGLGLGFYQGQKLFEPGEKLLIKRARAAFVMPSGSELEATLNDIAHNNDVKNKGAARDFDLLKTYLMVTDPKRLDIDFAANILIEQWKKRLHPDVGEKNDLLESNAKRYLGLLAARRATWLDKDTDLIRGVRQALKAKDAEYCRVIGCDNDGRKMRPFTLRDALRGRVQLVLSGKHSVPGVYTRIGWSTYVRKRLAARMVAGSKIEPWVLGEEATKDVNKRLRKRYYEQYIAVWRQFLHGLEVKEPTSPKDALAILDKLVEQPALYKDLLEAVAYNVELPMIEAGKGNSALGREAARLLPTRARRAAHLARRTGGGEALKKSLKGPKTAVESYFEPLVELVSPPKGVDGRAQLGGLEQYLSQLNNIRDALATRVSATGATPPTDPTKSLDAVVAEARRVTKGVLASLPGELRRLVSPLFYRPLEAAASNANVAEAKQTGKSFSNELCEAFSERFAKKYPFARAKEAARLDDVKEFFAPDVGRVWSYYNGKLAHLLQKEGDRYSVRPGKKLSGGIVSFVNQAWQVRRALYPFGSNTVRIRFELIASPAILTGGVGHQISEIILEVDGVAKTYRNGPPERWSFEWKGEGKRSRLLVRGANGLREELAFTGDWSLMRLIDRGKVSRRGSLTRVIWSLKNGEIKIPMDFRPSRSHNPLFRRWRLRCR